MLSICLLVSGGLGFEILKQVYSSLHVLKAVFTDRLSESIIGYCTKNNIPLFIGNPRNGRAVSFIEGLDIDLLLSVNYLFLIENYLIRLGKKASINIHGSLLPKYRGRTPHVWAIINGEEKTGITAHLIDEEVDNGDIIQQLTIPIGKNDTGGDILNKFNALYPEFIKSILADIVENKVKSIKQNAEKATYFGKRTPNDGLVNWNWHRERIRNWIRALAKPYPGAFTYHKGRKIIIHNAIYSDLGFNFLDPNGTILAIQQGSIIVKTPNGALELSKLEFENSIQLKKGELLI